MKSMLGGRNKNLKPQDVLLLLKILSKREIYWRIIDLAHELYMSPSEITLGLERLKLSGLLDADKKNLHRSAVLEFLIYGLKYIFPAQLGTISRGIPTSTSFLHEQKFVTDMSYVWASEEGSIKGITVSPLYESAPIAALKDKKLHKLLALIDDLRIGRAREKEHAKRELAKELEINEF